MSKKFFTLLRGVFVYYAQWPLIIAVLAVGLNVLATVGDRNGWLFSLLGNGLFLFLVGHVASKANLSISELHSLTNELQTVDRQHKEQLSKLKEKSSRAIKLGKSANAKNAQSRKKIQAISNKVDGISEGAERLNHEIYAFKEAVTEGERRTQQALQYTSRIERRAEDLSKILTSMDARYSTYLSTHPALVKLTQAFDNQAYYENHHLSFKQLFDLLDSYFDPNIIKINLEMLELTQRSSDIVLVHQMGKVGSAGIYYSLLDELVGVTPVLHTHSLDKAGVYQSLYERLLVESSATRSLPTLGLTAQISDSLVALCTMANQFKEKQWKVITLVRDPIARNISAFFQNIHLSEHFPSFCETGDVLKEEIDAAVSLFMAEFPHHVPLTWLDTNIRDVFNIDVFNEEFDCEKGYRLYSNDNVNVLLIKLEQLDRCYTQSFKEFMGIEDFNLKSVNKAMDKQYSALYKEFMKRIRLPSDYIEHMYSSAYAKHFYSDEELHELTRKWSMDIR